MGTKEHFGAAKSIFDRLAEQPGKGHGKKTVADHVQETHRFILHGIDQPHAIHEIGRAGAGDIVEFWQVFRWNGQICVQDEKQVAGCGGEGLAHRPALAFGLLLENFDAAPRVFFGNALNLFPRIVL